MNEHRIEPRRRGSVRTRVVVAVGSLLAAMPLTPARADVVTVGFGFGSIVSTSPACQVAVPFGASGAAVLDAAVAKGCIQSYRMSARWNGHEAYAVVRCINDVCEQRVTVNGPCHFSVWTDVVWMHSFYRADLSKEYGPGLEDFRAANGKSIALTYGRPTRTEYLPVASPAASSAAPGGDVRC